MKVFKREFGDSRHFTGNEEHNRNTDTHDKQRRTEHGVYPANDFIDGQQRRDDVIEDDQGEGYDINDIRTCLESFK
jgi:hypothetical protein